jgi:hypothetical protein
VVNRGRCAELLAYDDAREVVYLDPERAAAAGVRRPVTDGRRGAAALGYNGPAMVSRDDLKRFVEGHRAAGARLRAETLRQLRALTVEEARAEYDSLCRVWEASRGPGDEAALDRLAIRDRVSLRRRLRGRR